MPQDYILRLLEQLRAIVATIATKRTAGDLEGAENEISEQCLRHIGLPFIVVKQASPEGLAGLLAMGGAMQVHRSLILAELLRQDAELALLRGNPLAAVASFRQAERLYATARPSLVGEDATAVDEARRDVAARLRDLGD